jgi:hypothetical protein
MNASVGPENEKPGAEGRVSRNCREEEVVLSAADIVQVFRVVNPE